MSQRPPTFDLFILTGFLGAGKTTLLNSLLRDEDMKDSAILINEIGEIGLDHLLILEVKDDYILLSSGCLCCSVRGELVTSLEDLLKATDNNRIPPFKRVIIETTGLADPSPVIRMLLSHPYFLMRFKLAGVFTLVDTINGLSTLDNHEEARRQVACSDFIHFTKTDLQAVSAEVHSRVKALSPLAEIITDKARIKFKFLEKQLNRDVSRETFEELPDHTNGIKTYSLTSDKALQMGALMMFIDLLRSQHGDKLLRVKGLVKVLEHPQKPVVIQGAGHILHPLGTLESWGDDDSSRIIFITKDLEREVIDALFNAFLGLPQIDKPDLTAMHDNPLKLF
jgi:G3E family GTPase